MAGGMSLSLVSETGGLAQSFLFDRRTPSSDGSDPCFPHPRPSDREMVRVATIVVGGEEAAFREVTAPESSQT